MTPKGKKHAGLGDLILISVKEVSSKGLLTGGTLKVKKKSMSKAIVVRTKSVSGKSWPHAQWSENAVVLVKITNKKEIVPIGTRVRGSSSYLLKNRRGLGKISSVFRTVI